ncbi:hypothetical protein V2E24_02225 [Mycoplasmopsis ciconiae]|uniref:Asp23/Gls24 family envelope stress response protein n=1 Tax=Mycoplasmopsis ciconiae TaxID=561067 RepID=A0ABU7MLS2_9BACT|nr:hypothetical protein [Mycoplasmopsis ciconiae]
MDLMDIKKIFLSSLTMAPGVAKVHPCFVDYSEKESSVEVNTDQQMLDALIVERDNNGFSLKCTISIIHGVNAKNLINDIHKYLMFNLKKINVKHFSLSVYIKGVIYE